MRKRYIYSLLFGIPGFFISGITTLLLFGVAMGTLWLFIFGDNPWPSSAETILAVFTALIFLIFWSASIVIGYYVGKKLENNPELNWSHVLISGGLTLAFILMIVFHQWSVGNLGPKPDTVLCSDFCVQHGYAGSGMPPLNSGDRTCSCFDQSGNEALRVPVDQVQK